MEPGQEDQARLESRAGMRTTWHHLVAEAAFPAEGKLATRINGWFVLVGRTDDGLFAVNDRCTHQAAQLSNGRIRRGMIMCPLHGARFELQSGQCVGGAYPALRQFPLRVVGGKRVVVADGEPAAAEFECGRVLKEEVAGLGLEEIEARRVDLTQVERRVGEIGIDGERAC